MRYRVTVWAAALAAAALGWSCARSPQQAPGIRSGEDISQTPVLTDAQLLEDVKKLFAADPVLAREDIQISVEHRQVTLSGRASSDSVRIKAQDKARMHPQVTGVYAEKLVVE